MLIHSGAGRHPLVLVIILIIFGVYCAALAYVGATYAPQRIAAMFAETGFFERASGILWIIAALTALLHLKYDKFRAVLFSASFGLLCARENDLHRAFTQDSILKLSYYRHSVDHEKYFSAAAVLFILAILGTFFPDTEIHVSRKLYPASMWPGHVFGLGLDRRNQGR